MNDGNAPARYCRFFRPAEGMGRAPLDASLFILSFPAYPNFSFSEIENTPLHGKGCFKW